MQVCAMQQKIAIQSMFGLLGVVFARLYSAARRDLGEAFSAWDLWAAAAVTGRQIRIIVVHIYCVACLASLF